MTEFGQSSPLSSKLGKCNDRLWWEEEKH